MGAILQSGQGPFTFIYRDDLHTLPASTVEAEINLHGGFALDMRPGYGQAYYGMPGHGVMRVEPDLRRQDLIPLPADLAPLNFHSTKIGVFDGRPRLILPAEGAALVAVVDLDGRLDFVLPRPEFDAYAAAEAPFRPTDTALVDDHLYVADGYGSNYISRADVHARRWLDAFGGPAGDPPEDGKFSTAHGLNRTPDGGRLAIADRPNSRIQEHGFDGRFLASHHLPAGAWPCGINFFQDGERGCAVVGNLRDPVEGRPAPIYILDADSYEVISTIRPKEELGVERAQHLHNVIPHAHGGKLYLLCQSWNPGWYFVLERVG
jgi:hypothetical protein